MAYTAQQLITRAWFLSGVVGRNLQIPTGDQITNGLALLNSLLDFKQIETEYLPYFTYNTTDYVCVPGQENYFIKDCCFIQSITFNINVVRYPMDKVSNTNYFGSSRVDNIQTLPFSWTYVREKGGGNLSLYFVPDGPYPLKIFGKFFLTDVSLTTDLTTRFDTSYIEYLRYALARFMCSEYGIQFNPASEAIFQGYQRKLMYMSPPDLSMKKSSILTETPGINYGDVNIGHGWRVS